MNNCRICFSDNVFEKYKLYDDRYGYNNVFTLCGCKNCSHHWLECNLTSEQISQLYSRYYPYNIPEPVERDPEKLRKRRRSRRLSLNPFMGWLYGQKSSTSQWVPNNIRLLDIGCGIGDRFKYHIERGCDVYGIEPNEKARGSIEKSGYKIHIGLFDPNLYEPEFFDYVTMDQVLEHMTNPVLAFQGICRILKPHGQLILATPNARGWGAHIFGKRWLHWHAPYHLHFYSRKSMEQLADRTGFKIIKRRTVTHSVWLHMQWTHLATYPRKGEPSVFFGRHLAQTHISPVNENNIPAVIEFMDKWRINDLITRLFDFLNLGDNQIYILQKQDR